MSEEQGTRTASTALEIPERQSQGTAATIAEVGPDVISYERGAEIGRYVVLGKLGEGGMGTVFRAYDPDLDRQIALKLVRVRRHKERARMRARDRLLREAQALGQLSHPNVVAAYDVGLVDDDVFVAMELVEGRTFKTWLQEEKPSTAEMVRVLVAAGRGVAAAHDAGIVHRDFKPDNILVGDDKRVRVADFGLARAAHPGQFESNDDTPLADDRSDEIMSGEHRLSTPLTQFGTVIGTPGYLAPEQYLGEKIDEATDQFSFCVTLHEALYGVRPFPHKKIEEQRDAVVNGRVTAPPKDVKVPSRLRKIALRGLEVDKADRFPSMNALLTELADDPRARRRRILAVTLIVALSGGAGAALVLQSSGASAQCRGAEDKLADVWDVAVRGRVEKAFLATNRPYAKDTFRRVSDRLDQRAKDWVRVRTGVCTATRVRGDQSEELMDRRIQCLDRRLAEMRALTRLFVSSTDGKVLDKSVQATYALSDLSTCTAIDRHTTTELPPEDPVKRALLAEFAERLDHVKVLHDAGRYRDALPISAEILKQTERVAYLPLRARALFWSGWLRARAGDFAAGQAVLKRAAAIAATAKHDRLLARIATRSLYVLAVLQFKSAETLATADLVLAVVARAGDDAGLRADALRTMGYAQFRLGRSKDAMANMKAAMALIKRELGPEHPELGHTLNLMGNVLIEQGDYKKAAEVILGAMRLWKVAYGPTHPSVAVALNNLGHAAHEVKDAKRAQGYFEQALRLQESALGVDHPKIAIAVMNLGELAGERGNHAEALELYQRALKIVAVKLPANHPFQGYALTGIGRTQLALGNAVSAVSFLERALKVRQQAEQGRALLAKTQFLLAQALWKVGKQRERAIELAKLAMPTLAAGGDRTKKEYKQLTTWLEQHVASR